MNVLLAGHTCNAYCRGPRHAHTIYVRPIRQDDPARHLRTFADNCGVRFIHAEPAPEAEPVDTDDWLPYTNYHADGTYTIVTIDDDARRAVPWLLVWEETA